jgi:hypothetical protein
MTTPDASVWRTIARAWRANDETIADIAARTGTTVAQIKAHARAEDWKPRRHYGRPSVPKRSTRPKPLAKSLAKSLAESLAETSQPGSQSEPPSVASAPNGDDTLTVPAKPPNSLTARRALIRRMYSAIDTKLQLLEKHMQSDLARLDTGTDSSAADHERDTRAIGTLIKNLGTIADIDNANRRPKSASTNSGAKSTGTSTAAGTSSGPPTGMAALADEADRYRRELAARLRRIVDAQS